MLLDLCFMYQTFFETLPEDLEDFSHKIHGVFPNVVDTKHLVSQGRHDMHSVNNLQELHAEANKLHMPVIATSQPPHGLDVRKDNNAHHAGYDSRPSETPSCKHCGIMLEITDTILQAA